MGPMHNVDAQYNVFLWKVIADFILVNQVLLYTTQIHLRIYEKWSEE